MTSAKPVTVQEIRRHASSDDCWIVVDGNVWDISEFAPHHPGGEASMFSPNPEVQLILTFV
jgi:L-lactate dehydrogenase (cytochrome)